MNTLIIVILMLVLLVIIVTITMYSRKKEKTNVYRPNPVFQHYQEDYLFDETIPDQTKLTSNKKGIDTFDEINSLIKNSFHPTSFNNDEDCENLLISFLTQNLPNNIIARGHTEKGDKLDIVIDGTYALELIVADSEEKLLYIMDLSLKSKKYFDKIAVVIVDVQKIPSSKIQEFATQIEKLGIIGIIIEINIEQKKMI